MTLAMAVLAMEGAATQVASTEGLWAKARLAATLAYFFTKEMVGFAALLPSAFRSFLLFSSLPSHPSSPLLTSGAGAGAGAGAAGKLRQFRFLHPSIHWFNAFKASVARDISYGSAQRNLLDVYVPEASVFGAREQRCCPVVMFVHGGVWASGNKELFSHFGACLANYGVVTIVVQYTLYPEALAREQAREVSLALTWVLDNIEHYGGDPHRVTLMGHSAGAHLAALVVWERFKARQQLWQRQAEAVHVPTRELQSDIDDEDDLDEKDLRQPCNFVGLAGVYDIVQHLKHEQKRGVDTMSCMTRAMGGKHLAEAMSPVRLFCSAVGNLGIISKGGDGVGFAKGAHSLCIHTIATSDDLTSSTVCDGDCNVCSFEFPRCTLLCSTGDTVVPPDTSVALHAVLQEQLGLQSELVVFDNLRHSDFVTLDGRLPELVSLRSHILHILEP